jgi:RHS repeat-associated protein
MVHVNGKKVGGSDAVTKFTAYVSPYFVVSNGGAYTKHIYAANQRIASKLGNVDGFGADPRRVEMAGGKKISDIQKDNIGARYKELGFTYSAPEKEKVEKDSTMDSEEPENLVFFYHPDHLGSTSYVTDADGNIAQHIEYIPYGEVFVEERNNSFSTNYLFNAKELDNETGLYYYGARYLDPTGAMWLSVDPVFHAGTSPYAYCLGNPVKMVDPDGRENIVYLVDLMTSKQQKNVTAAEVIEYVNNAFQNLGIKTRVQMAPLGFDPKYIDAHDSYAVLGSRNAIKQFVESKDKNSYDKYFADWSTGDVAERAALDGEKWTSNTCHYEGSFTTGVGVDVDATSDVTCPELSSYHTNPVEYTAFTLMHALGHNAKAIHPDDRKCKGAYDWKGSDMTIMYSGSALSTMISNDDIPSLSECMKLFPKSNCGEKRNNIGFIFIMFDRFGNKTPVDNYERKRMELNR